ncbi:hypothetical protein [Kribbella sp. NPDC004536]|uniref:hypothetical protein n=1 Tax=Kribbella sp. NPDC004536 TaxID=3364106 RepID=UPI0036B61367
MNDVRRRAWMEGHLEWAAGEFGVRRTGAPVHTSRLHSVGCRVLDAGQDAWLRVVYADPEWGQGSYLGSNVAANEILGVPKPIVERWREWDDNGRRMRGELSTFVADRSVSAGMAPSTEPHLSDQWIADLNHALHALATHPLPKHGMDPNHLNDGIRAFFGVEVDIADVPWTTAHCDLHWANLTAPHLTILDWETWGKAPVGYDAASLLCATLAYPALADRLRTGLGDFLGPPTAHIAILTAATRYLRFADGGELTELALPIRRLALETIDQL